MGNKIFTWTDLEMWLNERRWLFGWCGTCEVLLMSKQTAPFGRSVWIWHWMWRWKPPFATGRTAIAGIAGARRSGLWRTVERIPFIGAFECSTRHFVSPLSDWWLRWWSLWSYRTNSVDVIQDCVCVCACRWREYTHSRIEKWIDW